MSILISAHDALWGDLTKVNLPELRRTIDIIKKDPTGWSQADWAYTWKSDRYVPYRVVNRCIEAGIEVPICGTAYCLAGHVAVANGCVFEAGRWAVTAPQELLEAVPALLWRNGDRINLDEEYLSAAHVGRVLLGLNPIQANWLFAAERQINDFEYFYAKALEQQGGTK